MFPNKLIPFISGLVIAGAALPRANNQLSKWAQIAGGLGFAWYNAVLISKEWLTYANIIEANLAGGLPVGKADNDNTLVSAISFGSEMLIALIIFIIGCVLAYFWLRKKRPEQLRHLAIVAIGGIAVAYAAVDIVDNLKNVWGRFRPYEILIYNAETSRFTPWWYLNGNTGHRSFPSGHSVIAATILYIPFFIDRSNVKLQKWATVLCGAYVVTMMLTRLRLGAHHLSDVTVGASVSLIVIYTVTRTLNYFFIEEK
jgi:membrane-associated phospholipid phosphatase